MAPRKKSFIDKKNSVTYALMARPEGEADPSGEAQSSSPQVWMRKDRNHHARDALAEAGGGDDGSVFDESSMETGTTYSGATGYSAYSSMSDVTFVMGPNGPVPRRERLSREKRRELRELGFDPNDGYDYTRHLRSVGEGGGVMFVPTRKDHVRGVAQNNPRGQQVTPGGSGKRGVDDEAVYLREDVERDGPNAAVDIGRDDADRGKRGEDDERWTHERVKAVTDERVYVAKGGTSANAVVARAVPSAPRAGVAASELRDMIEKMEEFEVKDDDAIVLQGENEPGRDDGGVGDLQDDFILQAMMGDGDIGDGDIPGARVFPPVRLRYDEAEVERELATVEECVEEDALEEEEAALAAGGGWLGGGGGGFGGPGSDAGTDRDIDEGDWDPEEDFDEPTSSRRPGRARGDLGAAARDVDERFDAMVTRYDSDEIGELDDDDPRCFGAADIERFASVMDEFREEVTNERYLTAADVAARGDGVSKAGRLDPSDDPERARVDPDDLPDDLDPADDRPDAPSASRPLLTPTVTSEDVSDAFGSMIATRRRAGLPLPAHLQREMSLGDSRGTGGAEGDVVARRYEMVEDGDAPAPDGLEIAYLKRDRPRETWDCETIVSTYSNLENHPSLIDEPLPLKRGRRRGGGGNDGTASSREEDESPSIIRLSAANGLPVDYVRTRGGGGGGARRGGSSTLTAANLAAVAEAEGEGEGEAEGLDGGGSEMEEEEEEDGEAWRSNIRRKGETPEEKRARKAAVKAGRRDARAAKKGLKTTFKREAREMEKKPGVGDVRPGLSVKQLD